MNNNLILAAAIVAAALIVKYGPVAPGRYQVAGGGTYPYVRIDTATGDAWQARFTAASPNGYWVPFADNGSSR
jgi:hypothetical protein